MVLVKTAGDKVEAGDVLAIIHDNENQLLQNAIGEVKQAYEYAQEVVKINNLIYKIL
nr:hypothetical protein [Brevibacillus fluminis]